jgi:hypothetical protein
VVNEDLHVVIGCFGRRDDDFIGCAGVENRILKVDLSIEGYNKMMDYFEGCRLFDRPLFDINAIRNFVFYIQRNFDQGFHPIWSEKQFHLYQKFIIDHRMCGVYIKLILIDRNNDIAVVEKPPETIMITGAERLKNSPNKPKQIIAHPRFRRIK